MSTRRLLSALLVLALGAAPLVAAVTTLQIVVDAGVTPVAFDGRDLVVQASAPVAIEFRSDPDGIVADVALLPGVDGAAVRISLAEDPDEVIFEGWIRGADDFADLFFHEETGRGEQ
ncbi:MAG TPA: hypothetical protein VKA86_01470 [Candidatus Krumholzibacteria bacterium]|nr:hypothetical protein [Candidatus Krumholzibacteria bacterium]